jgi:antirestriction protein ArdC
MTTETRADIYTRITAEIIAAIEAGADDWHMPWHHDGSAITRPTNVTSGKVYRGVNTLTLWIAAQTRGFASGLWGTYRQWHALGAQVRKSARATTIVFWKEIGASVKDDSESDDGDREDRRRFVGRGHAVFNRSQVDGYDLPEATLLPESERIAHADAFLAALNIPTHFGADRAYYRIDLDHIFMPAFGAFHDAIGYVGTYAHEAAHASGAKHRLDRDFGARFSRHGLAIEEITAELTAALVLADLNLAHHPRPDHAALCELLARPSHGRTARHFHSRQQGSGRCGLDACAAALTEPGPVVRRAGRTFQVDCQDKWRR